MQKKGEREKETNDFIKRKQTKYLLISMYQSCIYYGNKIHTKKIIHSMGIQNEKNVEATCNF